MISTLLLSAGIAAAASLPSLSLASSCDSIASETQRLSCLTAEVQKYQELQQALVEVANIKEEADTVSAVPEMEMKEATDILGDAEEKYSYSTPQLIWLVVKVSVVEFCFLYCLLVAFAIWK